MSLLQKLKNDQLSLRKLKNSKDALILTTLIGEASIIGKNNGNRESTDSEVITVIKKFIKNIEETLKIVPDHEKSLYEKDILTKYLPEQLTNIELEDIVLKLKTENNFKMGDIMKYLKENFEGRYDGKNASQLIKKILG